MSSRPRAQGYLQVDGRWYELSDAQYKRVFTPDKGASVVEALGFDPRRWMRDPKLETTAKVGGVDANHLSGAVDADAALNDLGLYEGATTPEAKRVVATIKAAAKHGRMDVFAGKEDGILRKVSVTAQTDPAKGSQVRSTLSFTMALDKVNEPVTIEAPKNALPASSIATIPRAKLGDEAGVILVAPSKPSPGTGTARRPHEKARKKAQKKAHEKATGSQRAPRRNQKAYVSCVQGAGDLAALERCQALLP